ncbi:MAG TPA: LEA type 2 family protein [Methylomirabilota bacterium]|nr:LEA type 2 family protein [Methylomirabilota bacterium]
MIAIPPRWAVQCSAALLLAGCATMEPPSVTLSSLRVQPSTVFEQRFLTTLRIQNPNTFDLDVEGLSFDLQVNDQPFAKGVGKGNVVVPAYGTGVVQTEAITTLMGFVRQFQALARSDGPRLSYRLTGKLKVRDRMFSIPFEMRGDDLLQLGRPKDRRDE